VAHWHGKELLMLNVRKSKFATLKNCPGGYKQLKQETFFQPQNFAKI
jgi:hypothetical protein